MFQGKFEHTMDEKGRIQMPSPFRRKLGADEATEVSVVVTLSDQCLAVYPAVAWEAKVAQIMTAAQTDPNVIMFKRLIVGSAQECPLDKAGRILVPADLRRHAGLEKDCLVVGQIDKMEIWSAERWQAAVMNLGADQMNQIFAAVAAYGLQL